MVFHYMTHRQTYRHNSQPFIVKDAELHLPSLPSLSMFIPLPDIADIQSPRVCGPVTFK